MHKHRKTPTNSGQYRYGPHSHILSSKKLQFDQNNVNSYQRKLSMRVSRFDLSFEQELQLMRSNEIDQTMLDRFWGLDKEASSQKIELAAMEIEDSKSNYLSMITLLDDKRYKWRLQYFQDLKQRKINLNNQLDEIRRLYIKRFYSKCTADFIIRYNWLQTMTSHDQLQSNTHIPQLLNSQSTAVYSKFPQTVAESQLYDLLYDNDDIQANFNDYLAQSIEKVATSPEKLRTAMTNLTEIGSSSRYGKSPSNPKITAVDKSQFASRNSEFGEWELDWNINNLNGSKIVQSKSRESGVIKLDAKSSNTKPFGNRRIPVNESIDGHHIYKWDQEVILKKVFEELVYFRDNIYINPNFSNSNQTLNESYLVSNDVSRLIQSKELLNLLKHTILNSFIKLKKWKLFYDLFDSDDDNHQLSLSNWLKFTRDMAVEKGVTIKYIRTHDEHCEISNLEATLSESDYFAYRNRLENKILVKSFDLRRQLSVGDFVWCQHSHGTRYFPAIITKVSHVSKSFSANLGNNPQVSEAVDRVPSDDYDDYGNDAFEDSAGSIRDASTIDNNADATVQDTNQYYVSIGNDSESSDDLYDSILYDIPLKSVEADQICSVGQSNNDYYLSEVDRSQAVNVISSNNQLMDDISANFVAAPNNNITSSEIAIEFQEKDDYLDDLESKVVATYIDPLQIENNGVDGHYYVDSITRALANLVESNSFNDIEVSYDLRYILTQSEYQATLNQMKNREVLNHSQIIDSQLSLNARKSYVDNSQVNLNQFSNEMDINNNETLEGPTRASNFPEESSIYMNMFAKIFGEDANEGSIDMLIDFLDNKNIVDINDQSTVNGCSYIHKYLPIHSLFKPTMQSDDKVILPPLLPVLLQIADKNRNSFESIDSRIKGSTDTKACNDKKMMISKLVFGEFCAIVSDITIYSQYIER